MNKFTIILLLSFLAGCATTQSAQVGFVRACSAWDGTFKLAVVAREKGKLTPLQIERISTLDGTVTPLCTGPLPADADEATRKVTAATTELAVMEAVKGETK